MFDTVLGQVTDLEPGQYGGRCHRSMAPEANGRQRRPRPGEEPCARLPELVTTEPTVPMPWVRPCFTRLRSRCVYPPPVGWPGFPHMPMSGRQVLGQGIQPLGDLSSGNTTSAVSKLVEVVVAITEEVVIGVCRAHSR